MRIVRTIDSVRVVVARWRERGERVALVPTMGNLHAGHLALVERAARLADSVVASIFVNPLQFNDREDYKRYPQTFEEDRRKLAEYGVAMVFAPAIESIYPPRSEDITRVTVPGLSEILEGAHRPGHFSGVATVVAVLFNIVQPDIAVFGEKDYQQLLIVRRMVADLALPVRIEGVATVRDTDGLALSSRNGYLSKEERGRAPVLCDALNRAAEAIKGGRRDFRRLEEEGSRTLESAGVRPDYFCIRRAEDLAEPDGNGENLIILVAGSVGKARLIDNRRVPLQYIGKRRQPDNRRREK